MERSLQDFLAAKDALSERLLPPSHEAGIVKRLPHYRVADAVAAAGRNVHAVGVGAKVVDGQPTGELCVRIYVLQKLPEHLLAPYFLLPKELDGLPTDIIESPPSTLFSSHTKRGSGSARKKGKRKGRQQAAHHPSAKTLTAGWDGPEEDSERPLDCGAVTSRQRPLVGGISAASPEVVAGTLGCFCQSTKRGDNPNDRYILSNSHVFGALERSPADDSILQPSVGDFGTSADRIAYFTRAAPLDFASRSKNKVDAAIARLSPGVRIRPEVYGIGPLGKPTTVAEGDIVRKCGRSTCVTTGIVRDISHNALVSLAAESSVSSLYLVDQLRIDSMNRRPFALVGDSGAIVVTGGSNGAAGLLCGGDLQTGRWAIANRIEHVLKALDVELL